LLELLLVMSILAILSSGAAIWFFGYQRQVEVNSVSKMIVCATLNRAQLAEKILQNGEFILTLRAIDLFYFAMMEPVIAARL